MATRLAADTPRCHHCLRPFTPGATWLRANYCRAAFIAEFVADNPHLTAWEIAQATGLLYSDVTRGLLKAREWNLVSYEAEERDQGGQRYRYVVTPEWQTIIRQWANDDYI